MRKIYSSIFINGKKTVLAFLAVLFSFIIKPDFGFGQTQTYTTPGSFTFTVPVGVSSITVSAWGGGGAGGGVTGGNPRAGGGGKGGSFVRGTISVIPGATYTLIVGAGGIGGTGNGGAGGTSSFSISGGGATLFNAIGGVGGAAGITGSNFGAGGNATNTGNIVSGSTTSNFYGGNGGNGTSASTASSGGGGGSAGAGSGGGNGGSPLTAGAAGTGSGIPTDAGVTGALGRGATNDGNGFAGNAPGGGGGGARIASFNNNPNFPGGNGGNGQVNLTYTQLTYKSSIISVSAASTAPWCPGETRNVQVTIKNTGTATWTDGTGGTPVINVGVKWNTNGANWADYYVRVTAANLAPGATATYTLPLTASNNTGAGYTTPLASGTNNLIFDVVYEGVSWFGDNGGGVGLGNSKYTTAAVTINSLPAITGQSTPTQTRCQGVAAASLSVTATGTGLSYQWYSNTTASNSGGTILSGATSSSFTPPTSTAGALYYYCIVSGSCTPPVTSAVSGAIIVNPLPAAAGVITGTATVCQGQNAVSYSVPAITNATGYVWTLPTGATIATGANTNSITVNYLATAASGNITVYGTNSCGNGTVSANYPVTVNPLPGAAGSITGSNAVCQGQTAVAYSVGVIANASGYTWVYSGTGATINGTGNAITIDFSSTATSGTLTVTGTNSCGSGASSATYAISVNQPPVITLNPAPATQPVCATANVTYSVTATGSGLTYQWLLNGNPISNGGRISGATSSTLNITGATSADGGDYSVVVAGLSPCTSVTSTNAHLDVNQSIFFTAQPVTPQSLCPGQTYTISASATGTVATYEWYKNGTAYAPGTFDGANTYTLTIPNVSASDAGSYRLLVDDGSGGGCSAANSNIAALNINTNTTTTDPLVSQTDCQNAAPTNLSVTGSGTGPFTFQWYSNATNDNTSGTVISGATSSTYTPATTAGGTMYYYAIVTGSCNSVTSGTAAVIVNPSTVITVNPSVTQTYCQNAAATALSVSATGTGTLTYQWYKNATNANTGGTVIGGQTTSTYTPPTITAGTLYYYVTVTGTCGAVTSTTAAVIVNPLTTISTQPAGATYCQNGTATALSVVAAGTGTLTYQWYSNTVNNNTTGTAIGGQTTSSYAPSTTTANTTYYYVIVTGGCGPVTSNTAAVLVNPSTVITANPSVTQTYCQNATATALSVSATGTGTLTYQWYKNATNANTGGTVIGGQTTSTYTPPTTTAGTLYYYVTVTGTCGAVTSTTAAVIVNPSTTISTQPAGATYCQNGTATALSVVAAGTGTLTYQWYSNTVNNNTTGTAIGGQTTSSYTPSTTTANTTYYYVIVTGGCGPVTSNTAAVLVNPSTVITANPSVTQTYCQNATATALSVSATGTGTLTYQWYKNATNANTGGTVIGGQTTSTYTPPTTTAGTLYYYVTVTGTCGAVTSTTAAVIVNPSTTISTQPAGATYCQNGTATALSVVAAGTGTLTYQWYSNTVNNNTTGTAIGGQTTSSYTPSTTTANTIYYYVTITGGCGSITSVTAKIVVNPSTVITTQPAVSTTYCQNTTASRLTVAGTGAGILTYQWYFNTVNSNVGGTLIGGATSTNYTPSTSTVGTQYYYAIISGSCGSATSNTATIIINPLPTITASATAASVCYSAAAQTTTLVYSGVTNAPISYGINYNAAANAAGFLDVNNVPLPGSPITLVIKAGTAPGTYTGTLTVTNGNGCSSTGTNFTVTINPLPTPTLTSNPVSPVCMNTTVTYSTDAGQVNYIWTFSGTSGTDYTLVSGGDNTSNTANVTWLTSGTKTVTVNYTNSNGCTATTATSNSIVVNPIPAGTVSITENSGTTANDGIICSGDAVTLTAPSGYSYYNFYIVGGADTLQKGTSNIVSSSALPPGANQIAVFIANSSSCSAVLGPVTITVNALPTPTLSPDKTNVCFGDQVTFTAGGGTMYNFKVGGSSVQSSSSATYVTTSLAIGSNSITVDVTNANGCIATSSPVNVTVNALPAGSLTESSSTICVGNPITFTATPSGLGNYNFKLDGVSQQSSGSNTYSPNSLTPGTHTVTVDVMNGSNCTAPFGPPQSVTVYTLPTGSLSPTENSGVAQNDNTICAGAQVTFTATGGYKTYAFYLNGTGAALQMGASNVYSTTTLADGDDITVVATNANSCSATFTSPNIHVIALPTGTLTASNTTICSSDDVTFTASPGYSNYNFMKNGATFANGNSNTADLSTIADGDTITVLVTDAGSCSVNFNKVTMHVNPLPAGTLSVNETSGAANNDGIICTGATVTFTATAGFANYNFKINGSTVQYNSTNTYTTNTLHDGDIVSVEVNSASNCTASFNNDTIKVHTIPAVSPITGPGAVCVNNIITLIAGTPGGSWSSNNASIAVVDASGNVTGVSAGNATISYTVANAFSCDSTVSKVITVNALPAISPIVGTFDVCAGSTTQLTDNTSGGAWSSGDNSIATIDNTGLVSGVSAGSVEVYYTTTDGTTGCISKDSASVTVDPLPVVAAITGMSKVCINSTITLSDATSGGIWSSSDNTVATVNPSGIVTGISGGSATISYSVSNASRCNTTVSTTVTVNPLPVPTLSGPNPICPGSMGTYTTELGQSNYTWTITGGARQSGGGASDNFVTINWGATGPYAVYVNYSDVNGCSGDTSVTVTSNTAITPTLTGDQAVCANSNGTYTTNAGEKTYAWTIPGAAGTDYNLVSGGDANSNTAVIEWLTPGTRTIKISFTDANGCNAASPTSLSVTVHSLPTAAISGNSSVCQNGAPQQITFTGASGNTPYTFTYTINAGAPQMVSTTGAANSVSVSAPSGTPGNYVYALVSVADSYSCSQNQSGSATVTVNPLATGTISGTTAVCQGSSSPLITFTGTQGTAPFTFRYNINGGATQTVTTTSGNTVAVPALTSTAGNLVYNLVSVSDANGCINPQTGSATVSVNPLPTAAIGGTTAVCINGASPNITFTGSNGTAPYTFTYNINGGSNTTIISSGSTAIISVPTGTAGTFVYNLVSVQDASGTVCTQSQTGSATITVNPASVGGAVTSDAIVCAGSNSGSVALSGQVGSVLRWEYSIDGGTTWTTVSPSNVTSSLTYTNLTQTTLYHAVVQSGACSSTNSSFATISVNPASVGGSVSSSQAICSGSTPASLTLSGNTGGVVKWQMASDAAFTTPTDIAVSAITLTGAQIGALTTTTYFRAVVQSGVCGTVNSSSVTITVNPLPAATISGTANACQNATSPQITFTGANGTAPYTFTYNINGSGTSTVVSTGNTATVSAPTGTVGNFTYNLVSVTDASLTTCSNIIAGQSATVTISMPPPVFVITPSSATLCTGGIQPLSAGASTSSSGSVTLNSGIINLAIPDNGTPTGNTGVASALNVSGIPAGAVITSVSAEFNVTHGADNELNINLTAPNGNSLNLAFQGTKSGSNYSNTIVSSTGTTAFNGGGPYAGTWKADAQNNRGAAGYVSNVTNFSSLFSKTNGNWTLSAEDVVGCTGFEFRGNCFGNDYTGTLNNWSITINYTVPVTPVAVTWSPIATLYTDAGATTPYAGQSLSTVYSMSNTGGSTSYTATATNAAGCSTLESATVTVDPAPTDSITADYCAVAGKVVLTVIHSPGSTVLWNNGKTTDTIQVNVSGIYQATALSPGGCTSQAIISVANELAVNGNFESGDVGFTTAYFDHTGSYYNGSGTSGLYPEDYYAVDTVAYYPTNGVGYHPNFYGKDHTTGHGNFMMVNGAGAQNKVWQETVTVLPNTNYYFSAWGLSLNNVAPFASLQFNINGAQVGSVDSLPAGINSPTGNTAWTQFYGTWTSGPTTTSAVISITDLQTVAGGNDFGLDDISFATLSTFIKLVSAPRTDGQTVCVNTPLTNIVYSAGTGASAPTVTGLPNGVTASWNGVYETITGTPTVPGNYAYTIKTTGTCQPSSATGFINVIAQKLTLKSGNASPTVCINNAIAPIVYQVSGTGNSTATVTGLPAGLTGGPFNPADSTITITGTPAIAGVFKDTVISTGICKSDTAYGTIIVQSQTITLSSATASPTACINNGISIIYTLGGTATDASITSGTLPAGVNVSISGTSFIISGTATSSGTYPYTIKTSGTCSPGALATGTITINPDATITLSSGSGALTTCINQPITVAYTAGGSGTNGSITSGSLPAGVTGSFNSGLFTISGTPTVTGTFTYTVTATGGCNPASISGSITVQSANLTLTSGSASQTACLGSTINNIVYTPGGGATGATISWLPSTPADISGTYSGGTFTISSASLTQLGTFTYTLTTSGGCGSPASVTGSITINTGTVGGTLPAVVSICGGASGILNLMGNTGNVQHWESSTDGGNTWTIIANTTTSLPYNNITVPTQYRAFVKSGNCSSQYSTIALIAVYNYWVGGDMTNPTDWNTAANWSDNQVPTTSCPNVYIPATTNQPVISGAVPAITNLNILSGANVTISSAGTLTLGGSINETGPSSIYAGSGGTLNLNGIAAQNLPALTFRGDSLGNLIVSNTSASGVTLQGKLDIYQSVTYGSGSSTNLSTGGYLTLKSNQSQTAYLGQMSGSNTITGDVTVERYIATGTVSPDHTKSWELLAIPTKGAQTINGAWQEGATQSNVSTSGMPGPGNPNPGYGTMLTSDVAGTTQGFDVQTPAGTGPSIKTYVATGAGSYVGPPNTTSTAMYNQKGYFVFVRGDRSAYLPSSTATETVLRSKGTLFTPANPPFGTTVPVADTFESVGNPYASAIDVRKIGRTGDVASTFAVWDPRLGSQNGYGAFQYFFQLDPSAPSNSYVVTPGGGSYGPSLTVNNYIQSGQAFFVQTTNALGGTVSFDESVKAGAGGNVLFTSPNPVAQTVSLLNTSLYQVHANGNATIVDGALALFSDSYSNAIDAMDARKLANGAENLAIKTEGKLLAVTSRHTITQEDTIFLNLTGTSVQNYRFHFDASGLLTVSQAFLEDRYLHTRTPINLAGGTDVDFNVANIAGSYAANRFRIVFAPLKALPVTITSLKAYQMDKDIDVEWAVNNEWNMKQYEVQKSTDGNSFSNIAVQVPTANNGGATGYIVADTKPVEGYNYYRIRSVDINGAITYTNVVKVLIGSFKQDITIYPNPITDGMIHLQLINQPEGRYKLRLLNKLGQLILQKQVNHAAGSSTELLQWDYNLAHGMYQLEITKPDGSLKDINVMY